MVKIEMAGLINNLITKENYKPNIKYEIVKGVLKAAVDFINEKDPEIRDQIFNNVLDFGTFEYPMPVPDQLFIEYVSFIKNRIKVSGWDKRLVLTLNFSTTGYRTATIGMDLEATAKRLGWMEEEPESEPEQSIMDRVSDTPTMDEINEFNAKSNVKRREYRAPLYTSRRPVVVQPDKRRDR